MGACLSSADVNERKAAEVKGGSPRLSSLQYGRTVSDCSLLSDESSSVASFGSYSESESSFGSFESASTESKGRFVQGKGSKASVQPASKERFSFARRMGRRRGRQSEKLTLEGVNKQLKEWFLARGASRVFNEVETGVVGGKHSGSLDASDRTGTNKRGKVDVWEGEAFVSTSEKWDGQDGGERVASTAQPDTSNFKVGSEGDHGVKEGLLHSVEESRTVAEVEHISSLRGSSKEVGGQSFCTGKEAGEGLWGVDEGIDEMLAAHIEEFLGLGVPRCGETTNVRTDSEAPSVNPSSPEGLLLPEASGKEAASTSPTVSSIYSVAGPSPSSDCPFKQDIPAPWKLETLSSTPPKPPKSRPVSRKIDFTSETSGDIVSTSSSDLQQSTDELQFCELLDESEIDDAIFDPALLLVFEEAFRQYSLEDWSTPNPRSRPRRQSLDAWKTAVAKVKPEREDGGRMVHGEAAAATDLQTSTAAGSFLIDDCDSIVDKSSKNSSLGVTSDAWAISGSAEVTRKTGELGTWIAGGEKGGECDELKGNDSEADIAAVLNLFLSTGEVDTYLQSVAEPCFDSKA